MTGVSVMQQMGSKWIKALEKQEVKDCLVAHRESPSPRTRHDLVGALVRAGIPRRSISENRIWQFTRTRRWAGAGNIGEKGV